MHPNSCGKVCPEAAHAHVCDMISWEQTRLCTWDLVRASCAHVQRVFHAGNTGSLRVCEWHTVS